MAVMRVNSSGLVALSTSDTAMLAKSTFWVAWISIKNSCAHHSNQNIRMLGGMDFNHKVLRTPFSVNTAFGQPSVSVVQCAHCALPEGARVMCMRFEPKKD
eukprot:1145843-Pelagomonas_calceolata.AAC.4